jgi:hypothetical protein
MSATLATEPKLVELFASDIFRSALSKPHLEATQMLLGRRTDRRQELLRDLCDHRPRALSLIDDVALADLPDAEMQIDGRLEAGSFELFYAETGIGKTTLATDRAACQTTGRDWLGAKVLLPGPVVYCALEGVHAFKRRLLAWKQHHGYSLLTPIGVYTLQQPINLMRPEDAVAIVTAVERLEPIWIYVDTQARATPGAEENSTKDLGQVVAHIDWIRRRTGAGLTLIHHTGKDKNRGARGNNSIEAAADTVISLEASNGYHILKCLKMRSGPAYDPVSLKLTPVGDTVLFQESEKRAMSMQFEPDRERELQAKITDLLAKHPAEFSTTEVSQRLKKRKADVLYALGVLEDAKKIVFSAKGKKQVWAVTTASESP